MVNFKDYIGKSICLNRDTYPVWLFNIQEYVADDQQVIAEQIIDSPNSDDIEVFCGSEWDVYPSNDKVSLVCDSKELFADVVSYLKEQVERCSGMEF